MLEYSEYKSLVDILEKSDVSNAYEDLMKKEDNVLRTVNHVVKHIYDERAQNRQFVHHSLYEIFMMFFTDLPMMFLELMEVKNYADVIKSLTKGHRLMLIALLFICISIFLFFIDISK